MLGGESLIEVAYNWNNHSTSFNAMSTNMQIAATSRCKSDEKRKYKQLLVELINDASIGHVIFGNHVIGPVSGWFTMEMDFAGKKLYLVFCKIDWWSL